MRERQESQEGQERKSKGREADSLPCLTCDL
jgi:hypothetical protein